MFRTNRNEVTVIDIIEHSCGVAIDRRGIGISLVTVGRHVTTGKHGIMNHHTTVFPILFRNQVIPLC